MIFLQKTKKIEQIAREKNIYLINLPPYSSNLSPIDPLWKAIKRELSEVAFIETKESLRKIVF